MAYLTAFHQRQNALWYGWAITKLIMMRVPLGTLDVRSYPPRSIITPTQGEEGSSNQPRGNS